MGDCLVILHWFFFTVQQHPFFLLDFILDSKLFGHFPECFANLGRPFQIHKFEQASTDENLYPFQGLLCHSLCFQAVQQT